jgi:DNA-binding transcriptional regulator LsrR (DeoR family)
MFAVESYAAVRRFVFVEGNSRREAARVFGLNRETVAKMCQSACKRGRFWGHIGVQKVALLARW